MVLLTHSTVSVIVSTGIFVIFTSLLFLSGYALQQQSVRNIQHAIRPPDQPKAHLYKRSSQDSQSDLDFDAQQEVIEELQPEIPARTTGNYAYLQLLSEPDPSNICSAIVLFKQLFANGTAIQDRLFMYPREWDTMSFSKPISTALSLLHAASLQYGIWLLPIDMKAATSAGYAITDTKLLRIGQIQFMQYDGVLFLQTPGLLLDSTKLDSVLTSRPLPLRHDKKRVESYNNEAWIPVPLRAEREADLPPVYLITVNNIENGNIEARGHIPNVALDGFGRIVTGPWGVQSGEPGYVFFERDIDGKVKWEHNPLFGSWRAQQYEVCDGLDFDDVYDDDDL
ncbi:hypothetical protein BJY01DRAFT_210923 [Aspergillus pseudoustus]|uniref:Uncharacterized protein n=1 Tax=Aspergillus pseudoustus TaxID=1810923 RepID=A0ABR4KAC8_9EURO